MPRKGLRDRVQPNRYRSHEAIASELSEVKVHILLTPYQHSFAQVSLPDHEQCTHASIVVQDQLLQRQPRQTAYMDTDAFPCVLTTPGRYYDGIPTHTAPVRRRTVYSHSCTLTPVVLDHGPALAATASARSLHGLWCVHTCFHYARPLPRARTDKFRFCSQVFGVQSKLSRLICLALPSTRQTPSSPQGGHAAPR